MMGTTAESQFFEPPRKTKIGSKNQRVREIGGTTAVRRGKRLLVRVIGNFEEMRVREIGIPVKLVYHLGGR